ncbi:MAG: ROK family protein, partial [Planctomycetaceae bacterium]|nr:ROK family protein [Planctomycetaceae bacterium]
VDLGGTSIKLAISDQDGQLLLTRTIPTESHRGPEEVIKRTGQCIRDMLIECDETGSVLAGLGMGVPGLVDISKGITKFLPNLPTQWREIPVAEMLQTQLRVPVRLMNDVRTATLGELMYGLGKNDPHITMAFFSIGTGIGGGLVLDGKLRLGPLGAAGEFGHQTVLPDGPRCGCGNRGCLEAIASGTAIAAAGVRLMQSGLAPALHSLVEGRVERVSTKQMVAVADQDPYIREALQDAAHLIGIAAANIVTILHPDLIVLGGGVAGIGTLLTETVRQVIANRVGMFPTDNVRVEQSLLGEQAGLRGAIALAAEITSA